MSKNINIQMSTDEFINDLENTLKKSYTKFQMTDGEIASLIERQKQIVIQARYED